MPLVVGIILLMFTFLFALKFQETNIHICDYIYVILKCFLPKAPIDNIVIY